MNVAHSTGRRIAGWTCIALGKIGSLLLLWALISGAEPDIGDDRAGTHVAGADALLGLIGIAPLFAITLGAVVIGVWILLKSERI